MSLWLSAEELVELTGYKTMKRQKIALGTMGVLFVSRAADGYPLVRRDQFENGQTLTKPEKRREPRLELVR